MSPHLQKEREKKSQKEKFEVVYFLVSSLMIKRSREKESAESSGKKRAHIAPKEAPKESLLSISASFKFHDLKADGVIDREELISYFKSDKTVAAIIERLDKNKDGVISYSGNYLASGKLNL